MDFDCGPIIFIEFFWSAPQSAPTCLCLGSRDSTHVLVPEYASGQTDTSNSFFMALSLVLYITQISYELDKGNAESSSIKAPDEIGLLQHAHDRKRHMFSSCGFNRRPDSSSDKVHKSFLPLQGHSPSLKVKLPPTGWSFRWYIIFWISSRPFSLSLFFFIFFFFRLKN